MLRFKSSNPQGLLDNFKKLINQKETKGKIDTWEEHDGGFRHTSKEWKDLGLFKASLSDDGQHLLFSFSKSKGTYSYAYYHGHLLQSFVQHLNKHFELAQYLDDAPRRNKPFHEDEEALPRGLKTSAPMNIGADACRLALLGTGLLGLGQIRASYRLHGFTGLWVAQELGCLRGVFLAGGHASSFGRYGRLLRRGGARRDHVLYIAF
jgi:hypothetical protein